MKKDYTTTKTITIPISLVLAIEKWATERDFSFSRATSELLEGALYLPMDKPSDDLTQIEKQKHSLQAQLNEIKRIESELKAKDKAKKEQSKERVYSVPDDYFNEVQK